MSVYIHTLLNPDARNEDVWDWSFRCFARDFAPNLDTKAYALLHSKGEDVKLRLRFCPSPPFFPITPFLFLSHWLLFSLTHVDVLHCD